MLLAGSDAGDQVVVQAVGIVMMWTLKSSSMTPRQSLQILTVHDYDDMAHAGVPTVRERARHGYIIDLPTPNPS